MKIAKASSNKVLIEKFEREWAKLSIKECNGVEDLKLIMTALLFINDKQNHSNVIEQIHNHINKDN